MDILQLERFVVLAETGQFRRAARQLGISQPALTHSIKTLEEQLDTTLFSRSLRGATLTEVGRGLLARARAILNERDRMLVEIGDLKSQVHERLTVGVAPYFSRRVFTSALARLLMEMPEVRLEVLEGHSDELRTKLQENRIEMAFCVLSPAIESDSALEHVTVCTERYSIVARKRHPIHARSKAVDHELAKFPWVVYDLQRTPSLYTDLFRARGIAPPSCPIATLSLPLMASIVASTDHLALMPEDFVWPELAASRLQRVSGHSIDINGRGCLVWRRGEHRSEPLKKLIRAIRAVCEERPKVRRGQAQPVKAMGQ